MGTFWTVSWLKPPVVSVEETRTAVEAVLERVIAQMSHWDERSDLCMFNRAVAGTWCALPPEFYQVLSEAVKVAEASGGCCDPTVGEIVDLYGFGPSLPGERLPDHATVRRLVRHCGWKKLTLDAERRATLQPGGLRLDLSSIAKGFAVDLAAEALEALGISSYLVEIGGEVRGAGCKEDGEPWWCLLEIPPGHAVEPLPETIVALCGLSLATSGDSQRWRQVEGSLISHLIDPRTGRPAANQVTSVSVFAETCMRADAWATALYVAGAEDGPPMAEAQGLAALFTIRTQQGLMQTWTRQLAEMLE